MVSPAAALAGSFAFFGGAAPSFAGGMDAVDAAASKFAKAAYPLAMKIDWERTPTINQFLKDASSGWDPKKVAFFVDTLLETGLQMQMGNIVKAVKAHDRALLDAVNKP